MRLVKFGINIVIESVMATAILCSSDIVSIRSNLTPRLGFWYRKIIL